LNRLPEPNLLRFSFNLVFTLFEHCSKICHCSWWHLFRLSPYFEWRPRINHGGIPTMVSYLSPLIDTTYSSNYKCFSLHSFFMELDRSEPRIVPIRNQPSTDGVNAAPVEQEHSRLGWAGDNIVNPLINGLIEPYHDLAGLLKEKTGHEILPDCGKLTVSTDNSFGASLARSLSGTVGSIVPYFITGKFTAMGLGRVGRVLEGAESLSLINPGGYASALLTNEKTGMVLGAGLLGAARTPEGDQTRVGNAAGAMLGFAAYEGAGSLWAGWTARPLIQRAGAGVLGGMAQTTVQNLISNHDAGSWQETSINGVTGGVISTFLPLGHAAISHVVGTEAPIIGNRMPKERTDLTDSQLAELRANTEKSFRSIPETNALLGNGSLGKLFPSVFGFYEPNGGIVGRPQHKFQQYPIHAHSLLGARWLQGDGVFNEFPEKEQTNGYWMALLHDTGKRANVVDPHHEAVSGNLAWGVLGTMDYSPVRIQRLANLITRHTDLSYNPDRLQSREFASNPRSLDDVAAFYANQNQIHLLRRFNEADIRAINKKATLFNVSVEAELDTIEGMVSRRAEEMTRHSVPILTTDLPSRFSLVSMTGPYAVLGHVSDSLTGSFLKRSALVESPQNSMDTSLLTESNRQFKNGQTPDEVTLVTGPSERISQAYRSNLGTGRQVGWERHVDLLRDWSDPKNYKASAFAKEIEDRVRAAGVAPLPGELGALRNLRQSLAQYDTLDELIAEQGVDSPYVKGQLEVYKALTSDSRGNPNDEPNHLTLNNPTIVGLGILRQGRQVVFENMNVQDLAKMLDGNPTPDWLVTSISSSSSSSENNVVIPESVWRNAQDRDLPLVVLDP
jgi:hypothetical protein